MITRVDVVRGGLRASDSDRFSWKWAADHHVYLVWSATAELLYVGRTNDPNTRLQKHSGKSAWWTQADHVELIPMASLREAAVTEACLIWHLQPTHNKLEKR